MIFIMLHTYIAKICSVHFWIYILILLSTSPIFGECPKIVNCQTVRMDQKGVEIGMLKIGQMTFLHMMFQRIPRLSGF